MYKDDWSLRFNTHYAGSLPSSPKEALTTHLHNKEALLGRHRKGWEWWATERRPRAQGFGLRPRESTQGGERGICWGLLSGLCSNGPPDGQQRRLGVPAQSCSGAGRLYLIVQVHGRYDERERESVVLPCSTKGGCLHLDRSPGLDQKLSHVKTPAQMTNSY